MPGLYKKQTATQPVMPETRLEPLNVCLTDIKGNATKLMQPSGGPSGKYTKY